MSNTLSDKYAVPVIVSALVAVFAFILIGRFTDQQPSDLEANYAEETAPQAPLPAGEFSDDVFVVVEQPPSIKGGLDGLIKKIQYPKLARKAGIQGRVIVQFVVDEQGNARDAKILRGIGGGCDEEALRVINETQFVPGMQRGNKVKVRMALPVVFKLS